MAKRRKINQFFETYLGRINIHSKRKKLGAIWIKESVMREICMLRSKAGAGNMNKGAGFRDSLKTENTPVPKERSFNSMDPADNDSLRRSYSMNCQI